MLPAVAAKQCIKLDILATSFFYTSYSLRLNHFLKSLIQYANFFKIRQKNAIAFFISYIWRSWKKLAYCIRELRKWLCCKLYEVKISKYVEFNALFCGNSSIRGKTKMDITRSPLNGYLNEIHF